MGDACHHCHGMGVIKEQFTTTVTIPAGAPKEWSTVVKLRNGQVVRIRPEWKDSSRFTRDGNDLHYTTTISLKEVCD